MASRKGLNAWIEQAIADMTPLQRDIVQALLALDDEMTDEILAERHGTSAAAVRVQRSLARMHLCAVLKEKRARGA